AAAAAAAAVAGPTAAPARRSTRNARLGVAAAVLAGAALAAGPLPALSGVRGIAASDAKLVRFLSAVLSAASDVDRDGHGFLFGGRDCAPFNPRINPDAVDVPGNGVDENCRGGDATRGAGGALAGGPKVAPLPPGFDREWNFIIVSVDTLRADHLGTYGYTHNPTSPRIDEFAADSVVFENAISHGAGTSTCMPSLLTGRYFSNAPIDEKAFLLPNADTIAWRLRNAGWVTGGAFALGDWNGFNFKEGIEFADTSPARGNSNESETSDKVTDRALDFLHGHASDRFMLWLHYYDPHHNYIKHAPPAHFGDARDDLYDGEIRFLDIHFGRLLDELRAGPRWKDTIIVFTADHGESLGDHKGQAHGNTLYWEISHVPLIVHVPGAAPRRIKGAAAHVDVMPTVLNLAGVDPNEEGEGKTLVPEIFEGREDPARIVFSEVHTGYFSLTRIMSAYRPPMHLIYNYSYDLSELYDVSADAAEKKDLAASRPEVVAELRGALEGFIAATSKAKFDAEVTANLVPLAAAAPKVPLRATFGGVIELLGYDPCDFLEPHKKCPMALYLHALAPIAEHYKVELEAVGAPDRKDLSHVPMDGLWPTPKWRVGEVVRDNFRWWLPAKSPTQTLTLMLGFSGPDGRRLTTADGKTAIELAKVEHRAR
ncbi:MAG TPA: sulfatase, partial [Myxococcota bacterium]|nr:sulfatase [Myxococcota bacterium]